MEQMSMLDKSSAPAQGFEQAVLLYQQGRLDRAKQICKALLVTSPHHFNSLYLLGIIHVQQNLLDSALPYFSAALKVQPKSVQVLSGLGLVHARLGQCPEALACYDHALALKPDDADVLNSRGNALMNFRRPLDALASYGQALALRPDCVEALINRGNVLMELKRPAEALSSYEKAILLRPGQADAYYNLGNALRELKRPAEALGRYERVLALQPNHVDAQLNRGNALRDLKRFADALASYDKVLALRPDFAIALNNRGTVLNDLKRPKDALASYERAISLKADYADAYHNKGTVLTELGQFDAASEAIKTAIKFAHNIPSYYLSLMDCHKFVPGDPYLSALQELAKNLSSFAPDEQIRLHFALGKAYAGIADHERSFQQLLAGNALKRQQIVYNEPATLGLLERIRAVFTCELIRNNSNRGYPSSVPVFILGMPRSGSTLIEQILASHPLVLGAGEIDDLRQSIIALGTEAKGAETPEALASLSGKNLRQIGRNYLDKIRAIAPAAERITNKAPSNFLLIGLIHMALPNARIIHTPRNPIDTCVACFSQLFTDGNWHYTYDLAELGRYYRAYESLMAHWREVLPEGAMLEVQYEEVVADLEGQARRIIEYCGLEWDERCLDFHKTERQIRTASMAQVRQPLFTSSVGRWRVYEKFLQPLLDALADK